MTTRDVAAPGARPRQHALLVAGFVVAWVVTTALTDGLVRDLVVSASTLVPVVAVLVALQRRTLADPRPWWFVLVGVLLLNAHNVVWTVETHVLVIAPGSSVGAALLLPLGYLLLAVAGVLMLRPVARYDTGTLVDAAIVAMSLALLAWVLMISPLLADDVPTASRIRTMATLMALAGAGGALLRAALLTPERRGAWRWLLTGVMAMLVGTLARDLTITDEMSSGAPWVGHLWNLAYLALAAAATHPAAATALRGRERGHLSLARIWVLGAALAVGPVVQLVDATVGLGADPVFIAAVNLAIVPLVVLRIGWLARLHADAESRLEHLADHDALTGLPNRRALTRHLAELLPRVAAGDAPGAVVLFADLDDFKVVNDTLGHPVGDELLCAVAQRLRDSVRTLPTLGTGRGRDVVARFAGDEFVVVVEGEAHLADAARERIEAVFADDVVLADHVLPCRASVGVTAVPAGRSTDVDEVLTAADTRMYERKRARRAAL